MSGGFQAVHVDDGSICEQVTADGLVLVDGSGTGLAKRVSVAWWSNRRMTLRIAELPDALAEIGAGADLFSIGGPAHDRLCIERLGDRQAVYFSERGGRFRIRKFDDEDLACEFFLRYVEMMLGRRGAGGRTFRLLSPDEPGMRVDAVETRLRDLGVGRWHYSIGAAVEEKYSLVPTAEGWQSSFPVSDREWDSSSPQSEASAVWRFLTIFQSMRDDYDSLSLDRTNLARDE